MTYYRVPEDGADPASTHKPSHHNTAVFFGGSRHVPTAGNLGADWVRTSNVSHANPPAATADNSV